jgi:hypothetical protein
MVSSRLKGIIFNKLYSELSHLEIIEYKDEIWFIDREDRRWYFIYNINGTMWWKYGFFCNFFEFFSITERDKFGPILSSWVEEVLNCKVTTTSVFVIPHSVSVEEVLNCKVTTTTTLDEYRQYMVEEVLNCKVTTTNYKDMLLEKTVESVLNHKVTKTTSSLTRSIYGIEKVLNYKVERSFEWLGHPPVSVNVVLNSTEK